MADWTAFSGVSADNVQYIDGKAKADIANICGATTPAAGGATIWVGVMEDANICYASNSNLTSWTVYDNLSGTSEPTEISLAYGKDGSNNPRWVATTDSANAEILYSDDASAGQLWTTVNFASGNLAPKAIAWGNDVWMCVGTMNRTNNVNKVGRSTDGATWSFIDLQSIDSSSLTSTTVTGICTDGAGTWWFGQDNRLYSSRDNGSTWERVSYEPSWQVGAAIADVAVTNNTLVVLTNNNVFSGPLSNHSGGGKEVTTWSAGTALGSSSPVRLATYQGRCMTVWNLRVYRWNVDGTSITGMDNVLFSGNDTFKGIGTDGTTWMICADDGDIKYSQDDGDTWTTAAEGLGRVGEDNIKDIKPDVYLPL